MIIIGATNAIRGGDMTNYAKGACAERDFIERMKPQGYYGVRTAGSHSLIDVVLLPLAASNHKNVVVCQLKIYAGSKPKPSKEFKDLKFEEGITKWWVTRKDYQKEFEIGAIA